MPALRRARFLARLVLAWFALAVGVAVASPVVQPQSVHLVCSGTAIELVLPGAGDGPAAPHTLDCPLCATPGGLPPAPAGSAALRLPLPHVLQPVPAARLAARTAAPLPARGPPAWS
ncbi:MAG TPA: hypothetical protein VEA40_15910 [Ramlibacter sp.]|nr:hypothetical protein [Ramlibacter sp.]